MANTILFVFEGERTERLLLQSFQRYYFNEQGQPLITATFGTVIYSLFQELENDEFLDVVELLREKSSANEAALQGISREDISEIYLFFDHDGHASNADDEKIQDLLEYFDEETDQGKLYISYPMVEAVKHLSSDVDFQAVTAAINDNQEYKNTVSIACDQMLLALHELDQACWHRINHQHCMKASDLTRGEFCLPNELISQATIFQMQLEKHIDTHQCVSVLSAFPLMLLDYYGIKKLGFLIGSDEA